ncbi:MAG: methyl-accepting chemotaxis protein [Candidatus Sulfotelmatobacter sp.]|jgi:methyl-accepting chemotaxis protein
MSLKAKFRIMEMVAAAGLLTLAAFWIRGEYNRIWQDKEEKVRHLIDVPYSIVVQQQQLEADGKLTRDQAQRRALEIIAAMRYDGTNYFWVNDMHPTMVMHPVKPELNGHDLGGYKDPNGKALFVEMVRVVSAQGSGFVPYMWPKPGQAAPQPKLSFVKGFSPWGWMLGTGIYVDDVAMAWHRDAAVAAGLTLVCLIVLLSLTRRVAHFVLITLNHMLERVRDIGEGQGDLAKRVPVENQDELGELATAFNTFLEKLHNTIKEIAGNTRRLAESSDNMSNAAGERAQESQTQRDQTQHAADAVREMDIALEQVSQNSSDAANAARQAAETAQSGGAILEQMQDKVRSACATLGEAARMVEDLANRSDKIGTIVETINGIADQTNMLALNAAIEAARAGNMGRSFAVVADEVRKLAERTGASTKEIAGMVHDIQEQVRNAVAVMHSGGRQFEDGLQATERAGASFLQMIMTSQQVEDMTSRIATATIQQSAASKSVNGSVGEIARITESAAKGAEDANRGAEELSRVAADLQRLVGQFRLSSTPSERNAVLKPGQSALTSHARAKRAAAGSTSELTAQSSQ